MNISCSARKDWQYHIRDWLDYQRSYAKIHSNFEFDYDDIDYAFGSVEGTTPLYGGRVINSSRISAIDMYWLYDHNIGVKITLSSKLFNDDMYKESSKFLQHYQRKGNAIITFTDELAKRIKEDFPDYEIEASCIQDIVTPDKLKKKLSLGVYDTIVLPIHMNDDIEFLKKIKDKEQIRLFINAECSYTCPKKLCYPKIGLTNEVLGAEHDPIQAFIQGGAAALTQKGEGQEWFVEGQKQTTMDHACSAYLGLDRIFHQDEIEWEKFYFPLERFQQFGINKWKVLLPDISQGRWQLMHKDFYEQFA